LEEAIGSMIRVGPALALIACLGHCLAVENEIEQPSETWGLPRTGTRGLLGESDHKYKIHDRIKLYGETSHVLLQK
jgi:hypothetical protein